MKKKKKRKAKNNTFNETRKRKMVSSQIMLIYQFPVGVIV